MTLLPERDSSELSQLAINTWGNGLKKSLSGIKFDPSVVRSIYENELKPSSRSSKTYPSPSQVLELSGYLENYLWPNYTAVSPSFEHTISVVMMVLEKGRESMNVWSVFNINGDFEKFSVDDLENPNFLSSESFLRFSSLFCNVCLFLLSSEISLIEKNILLSFLVYCVDSLDVLIVRKNVQNILDISIWCSLSSTRLELELSLEPDLAKLWKRVSEEFSNVKSSCEKYNPLLFPKGTGSGGVKRPLDDVDTSSHSLRVDTSNIDALSHLQKRLSYSFVPSMLSDFLNILASIDTKSPKSSVIESLLYCEKFVDFLVSVSSQLLTRRYIKSLLSDGNVLLRCERSGFRHFLKEDLSLLSSKLITSERATSTTTLSISTKKDKPKTTIASSVGLIGGVQASSDTVGLSGGFFEATAAVPPVASLSFPEDCTPDSKLFFQLLDLLSHYTNFSIDDASGSSVTDGESEGAWHARIGVLQGVSFRLFGESNAQIREFALTSLHPGNAATVIQSYFSNVPEDDLRRLCENLRIVPVRAEYRTCAAPAAAAVNGLPQPVPLYHPPFSLLYGLSVLLHHHRFIPSIADAVRNLALFPTEHTLWDADVTPPSQRPACSYGAKLPPQPIALHKMNCSYLSLYDYLYRSFSLYRAESSSEIRADVVNTLRRLAPRYSNRSSSSTSTSTSTQVQTFFGGWSEFAVAAENPRVSEILQPTLNFAAAPGATSSASESLLLQNNVENEAFKVPAAVFGEVSIDLAMFAPRVRMQWDQLREHDAVFLLSVKGVLAEQSSSSGSKQVHFDEDDMSFRSAIGVSKLRGATIVEILDENGTKISDFDSSESTISGASPKKIFGTKRTLKLSFDPVQFYRDGFLSDSDSKSGLPAAGATGKRPSTSQLLQQQQDTRLRLYSGFNVLMRREPATNTFYPILKTLSQLMAQTSRGAALPKWLEPVILGVAHPASASRIMLPPTDRAEQIDVGFMFEAQDRLVDAFNGYQVQFKSVSDSLAPSNRGPFILSFGDAGASPVYAEHDKRAPTITAYDYSCNYANSVVGNPAFRALAAHFRLSATQTDAVGSFQFTPRQAEAVLNGLNPGLSLIVGPPGTGKSDTAVGIVHNLYRTRPRERILILTHSNAALNDLFEKLLKKDIERKHLLRLGHGEKGLALDTNSAGSAEEEERFTKAGRVNALLEHRAELLSIVREIAHSVGVHGDMGVSCETADGFDRSFVSPLLATWRDSLVKENPMLRPANSNEAIFDFPSQTQLDLLPPIQKEARICAFWQSTERVIDELFASYTQATKMTVDAFERFPFKGYMLSASLLDAQLLTKLGPIAVGAPDAEKLSKEEFSLLLKSVLHFKLSLSRLFATLQSYRALEVLRSNRARQDYLLVHGARIVAMTVTHACIMRQRFVDVDFQFDSVVVEEAGQILEVETLLPLMMQRDSFRASDSSIAPPTKGNSVIGSSKLKRVVLLGDDRQLPPIVQNNTLARIQKLEQSLFARLIRLGVPAVMLDLQGRCKPELARLIRPLYPAVRNMLHTLGGSSAAGTQLNRYARAVSGMLRSLEFVDVRGEEALAGTSYSNAAEAAAAVALFQYLRLCGHSASSIAIITPYKGQRDLLMDYVNTRCRGARNALAGVFGAPAAVETVDRFQGRQADIVILSMVRSKKSPGHIRDVRRLAVALSRAISGFYVLGNSQLTANTPELAPFFTKLDSKGKASVSLFRSAFSLLPGEACPSKRPSPAAFALSTGVVDVSQLVEEKTSGTSGRMLSHFSRSPFVDIDAQITAKGTDYDKLESSSFEDFNEANGNKLRVVEAKNADELGELVKRILIAKKQHAMVADATGAI